MYYNFIAVRTWEHRRQRATHYSQGDELAITEHSQQRRCGDRLPWFLLVIPVPKPHFSYFLLGPKYFCRPASYK